MDDVCTYQIQVRGRVDLADLNAGGPVQMRAAGTDAAVRRDRPVGLAGPDPAPERAWRVDHRGPQ